MRARRCALVFVVLAACGDRSPPALWPEAPPPTLAKPIGIDEPVRAVTDPTEPPSPTDAAGAPDVDATAQPAPTSADSPYPAGGTPPTTTAPKQPERLPMPLL